jgi:hypothetical protein
VTRFAVVVLVFAVALVPQALAAPTKASGKFLPAQGVLTPGKSLAGVKLGDSMQRVRNIWGKNYKVCRGKQCPYPTWYYIYPKGEPLGASVRFRNGKVVTIFTLGSPTGWRTSEGLLIGEQIDRIAALYGKLTWSVCIGYGAMSMRTSQAVTSIYTTGEAVYGFALSRPSEPVCN